MTEIKAIINKIEAARFETAGGQLVDFIPWQELKERILAEPIASPGLVPPRPSLEA